MLRQQVKNVVATAAKKAAVSARPAQSRPMPLDGDALKRVVGGGGTGSSDAPNKGW